MSNEPCVGSTSLADHCKSINCQKFIQTLKKPKKFLHTDKIQAENTLNNNINAWNTLVWNDNSLRKNEATVRGGNLATWR